MLPSCKEPTFWPSLEEANGADDMTAIKKLLGGSYRLEDLQ